MAEQQAYQAYGHTNKGTLVPGQSISVNKYTVQVERYLSQGGFAHVYLVRTATPVYNTTHHVLKRIAVANEAMLSEVKKEVDIMRILKGHPNIVYLIDAAWHRMPNGVYEVFILMEFCPGGGIIDMMNRRLRERLTESEILQIFVDVCEGVAAMHNLRPSLLHRDLKVENILQSTPTSFKLCDFGSATSVAPKPPSSTHEIRALEADLNRHTTLQYRAPEMVDPYLRRPVDEKSDVWALGVLLYKLCYYTTPFEEHGPLAILNVQYRTPPYPVYSNQMKSLIDSMLREHGAQRPSVFELLSIVHRLRGTKSRFTYVIPSPQPLSPRHNLQFSSASQPTSNPLEELVQYRTPVIPSMNAGIQAREKVLEAIAPMRRGRPTTETTAHKENENDKRKGKTRLGDGFEDDEKMWNATKGSAGVEMRGHKSGVVGSSTETWKANSPAIGSLDDPWNIRGREKGKDAKLDTGFGDDFAEQLWNSAKAGQASETKPDLVVHPPPPPAVTTPGDLSRGMKITPAVQIGNKDAFEGLGLSSQKVPEPTLGEARKYRTGLAAVNGFDQSSSSPNSSPLNLSTSRPSSAPTRPTSSPRAAPQFMSDSPPVSSTSRPSTSTFMRSTQSPSLQQSALRSRSSQQRLDGLTAETRFPPLEELDSTFGSPSPSLRPHVPPSHSASQPQLHLPSTDKISTSPSLPHRNSDFTGGLRPVPQTALGHDGVRSEQVTGIAMRDSRSNERKPVPEPVPSLSTTNIGTGIDSKRVTITRPPLSRKHRSSVSIKPTSRPSLGMDLPSVPIPASQPPRQEPTDWLTGADDEGLTSTFSTTLHTSKPVMPESPRKQAAFVEKSSISITTAEVGPSEHRPSLPSPSKIKATTTKVSRILPTVGTDALAAPRDTSNENWSSVAVKSGQNELSSSDEHEDPEDAGGYNPSKETRKEKDTKRPKRKGRQSSVHDLVDLWGGGVTSGGLAGKEKDKSKEPLLARAPVVSHNSDASAVPPRRRATMQPLPGTMSRSSPPRDVPSSPLGVPAINRSPKRQSTVHDKQLSMDSKASVAPSNSRARPSDRPKSMFILPVSKSKSDISPLELGLSSPALSPPVEPPRRARRTSITDMVQRYEAIGGRSPPVVSKPAALKLNSQPSSASESERFPGPHVPNSPVTSRTNINIEDTSGTPAHRRSPTGLPRNSLGTSQGQNGLFTTQGSQVSPPKSTSLSVDASSLEKPSRRSTTSSEEQSSSPDMPYQGVGKLIDQWQKKTADANSSSVPLRRGKLTKRPGLASRGAARGQ